MAISWMGWLFGLLNGLRHALEPDHVAAVSTIMAEQKSARASMYFATFWGLGHAAVLLVVGGGLFLLRTEMPAQVADVFELAVALMLIGLGVRAIVLARHGVPPMHLGHHANHANRPNIDQADRAPPALALSTSPRSGRVARPLLIGVMHGLAGSGALTAIVLAKLPSPLAGVVFLALYGMGATLGMALLAGVAGIPLARIARNPRGISALMVITGVFSLLFGVYWGYPIVRHLLTR